MVKQLARYFVLPVAFSVCLNSQADPVAELNDLMSQLITLQASFSLQIYDRESDELLDENSGDLILKRPGYFFVHTQEPFEQFVISDRKVIWNYDVELGEATEEPVGDRLQQTPFLLLSGDVEAIRQQFSVSYHNTGDNQGYVLLPQDPSASYTNVRLQFQEDVLSSMSWDNNLGERNTIRFSDIKINIEVEDKKFSFSPPDGVELVVKNANQLP